MSATDPKLTRVEKCVTALVGAALLWAFGYGLFCFIQWEALAFWNDLGRWWIAVCLTLSFAVVFQPDSKKDPTHD